MVHLAPHSTLNTSTSSLSPTSPVLLSSSSPNPDLLSTHRQRPSDTFCCTRKAWCACCAASASISCSSHAGSTATNHPAKLVFAGSVPGQLPAPATCHKKVSASPGASRKISTNSVSAASVNVATGVCPVASWMWASLEGINVLGCSKSDSFGLNCCTISCNISYKKTFCLSPLVEYTRWRPLFYFMIFLEFLFECFFRFCCFFFFLYIRAGQR